MISRHNNLVLGSKTQVPWSWHALSLSPVEIEDLHVLYHGDMLICNVKMLHLRLDNVLVPPAVVENTNAVTLFLDNFDHLRHQTPLVEG